MNFLKNFCRILNFLTSQLNSSSDLNFFDSGCVFMFSIFPSFPRQSFIYVCLRGIFFKSIRHKWRKISNKGSAYRELKQYLQICSNLILVPDCDATFFSHNSHDWSMMHVRAVKLQNGFECCIKALLSSTWWILRIIQ